MEMFANYTPSTMPVFLAEEVSLEIAHENSVFRAVEEFVGALVGTQMRQHSTCQRNFSMKVTE